VTSQQLISSEIFCSSSGRHGCLDYHMLCYVFECTHRHTLNKHASHRLVKTELTPGLVVTCQFSIIRTVKVLLVTAVKRLLTRWSKARPTCCCYTLCIGVVERLCDSVSMHCQGSPAPPTSSRRRDATVQKLPKLISITGSVITGVFTAGS